MALYWVCKRNLHEIWKAEVKRQVRCSEGWCRCKGLSGALLLNLSCWHGKHLPVAPPTQPPWVLRSTCAALQPSIRRDRNEGREAEPQSAHKYLFSSLPRHSGRPHLSPCSEGRSDGHCSRPGLWTLPCAILPLSSSTPGGKELWRPGGQQSHRTESLGPWMVLRSHHSLGE